MNVNNAQRRRHWRQEKFLPYLLLAPALVLLAGMIYPFALGLYYSFTSYWLQYPNRFRFIWFDNYVNLVTEPLFPARSSSRSASPLAAVVMQVGLGLAIALFLHGRIPGRGAIRALMLLPLMMPPVITALMWKIMMASTNAGILNHMLSFIGVDPINWFGSTEGAVASILIIDTWGNLPFVALILLGGLQALPNEPYEAARVDGAGPLAVSALRHPAAAQPVHRAGRAVPDDGFAADLRRDLRHDAGRAERCDHQPAHHGVPIFLPVVPDGQRHGPGNRPAPAGRHRQLPADAALEPGVREHAQ